MKNGLYSINIHMARRRQRPRQRRALSVTGRDDGGAVYVISGRPAPTRRRGDLEGHLTTQSALAFRIVLPAVFGGEEVTSGVSGHLYRRAGGGVSARFWSDRSLSFRAE